MSERRTNGLSAWAPFLLSVVVAVAALGVGWGKLSSAAEQTDANKKAIELLQKNLGSIQTDQAVIKNDLKHENRRNEEFRKETSEDLNSILNALQRREPTDGR